MKSYDHKGPIEVLVYKHHDWHLLSTHYSFMEARMEVDMHDEEGKLITTVNDTRRPPEYEHEEVLDRS